MSLNTIKNEKDLAGALLRQEQARALRPRLRALHIAARIGATSRTGVVSNVSAAGLTLWKRPLGVCYDEQALQEVLHYPFSMDELRQAIARLDERVEQARKTNKRP